MKGKQNDEAEGFLWLCAFGCVAIASAYVGWFLDTGHVTTIFRPLAFFIVGAMVLVSLPLRGERKCSGKKRMERRSK